MSHKGIAAIIVLVTLVSIGAYSITAIIGEIEPISVIINSIQQDMVTEEISIEDEVIIQKRVEGHDDKWGRTIDNENATTNGNGTNHHIIINDGVVGTVTQG